MTETRIYAAAVAIAALALGCKSEQQKEKEALRAEVMALADQTSMARQSRVCKALDLEDRYEGPDDPQRTACATWIALTPAAQQVYMDSIIDQRPVMVSHPPLQYPEQLRRAGVQGRVVVRVIVDANGRVEPGAVKIISSTNSAFDASAKRMILGARYQPGVVVGHPMRVLRDEVVAFKIRQ